MTKMLSAALLVFALGCGGAMGGGGVMMTPQIIETAGSQTFDAPADKVFAATEAALKSEDFPIAISQPEKGFIKTGQKLIRREGAAVGSYGGGGASSSSVAADITRQYVVTIRPGAHGTTVSAEPRIFEGNAELTGQAIWDLDSPQGERALWQRLFRDIREAL